MYSIVFMYVYIYIRMYNIYIYIRMYSKIWPRRRMDTFSQVKVLTTGTQQVATGRHSPVVADLLFDVNLRSRRKLCSELLRSTWNILNGEPGSPAGWESKMEHAGLLMTVVTRRG